MIHRIDHGLLDQLFETLQVENHAGGRIGVALERHFQDVVMPMSVWISRGTIQLRVLLRRQRGLRAHVRR